MATVAFDADGTLWKGFILFGDPVEVIDGIPETLKELRKRGHRLVVVSKNDQDKLEATLTQHGLREFFDAVWASWGPKSEAFVSLDADTVFVDDDPFQLAQVISAHPGVEGVSAGDGLEGRPLWDPLMLLEHPKLTRDVTAEDRGRIQLLREQKSREQAEKAYTGEYQEFLRKSELKLKIYPHAMLIPDLKRALDLLNRTNELRTNANRYEKLPDNSWVFGASLSDKYGDYGQIATGLAQVVRGRTTGYAVLYDLAVSCRTAGRGVGSALVAWLCCEVADHKDVVEHLTGYIRPTDKNGPMRLLYQFLGFEQVEDNRFDLIDGTEIWRWSTKQPVPPMPAWLDVEVIA